MKLTMTYIDPVPGCSKESSEKSIVPVDVLGSLCLIILGLTKEENLNQILFVKWSAHS